MTHWESQGRNQVPTWSEEVEDIENLTANLVRNKSEYFSAPDNEQWRLGLAVELLELRRQKLKVNGFSLNEIEDLIHFTCTS